jgi:hypothetical protein
MPKLHGLARRSCSVSYAFATVSLAVLMASTQAGAGKMRHHVTKAVISPDGTVIKTPTSAEITTTEGAWTFGVTPNSKGDYPLLLNGSAANGGLAVSLQLTNGNLYAFANADGNYWCRFNRKWINVGSTAPVQGIVATKVTIHPKGEIPNNSPPGTIVASVTVTMSPPGTPFSRPLVSSDPMFTFRGLDVVLARALTKADDGLHKTRVTAVC